MQDTSQSGPFQVSGFYKFTELENPEELKGFLDRYLENTSILGTVLLAFEGVNGTISGPRDEVEAFMQLLAKSIKVDSVPFKVAIADIRPFHRMKVRVKKEIVTLGIEGIDPNETVGQYVKPKAWNELIQREDVLLVDTRNDYEYSVGSFQGAVNPNTKSFREFPDYVDSNMDPTKNPKVAMFCTGGIRCEKATAMMLKKGYKEVYHLEGGILEYFNQIEENESLWNGECFVFDERVTVNQDLQQGDYKMCHACRMPLNREERKSPHFVEGLSCPYCHDTLTEEKKSRLEQRNLQMKLAKERNEKHIGKRHHYHMVRDLEDLG